MKSQPSAPTQDLENGHVDVTASYQEAEKTHSGDVQLRKGDWDARLFSCFDFCVPNCFMATFCPCVSVAQITSRLGMYPYVHTLLFFLGTYTASVICYSIGSSQIGGGSVWYETDRNGFATMHVETGRSYSFWHFLGLLFSVANFVMLWQLRTRVRERFEIPGSCVEDFCLSWCCSCCSIAQMATHVKSYKPGNCDFGPADTLPAYS